MMNLVVCLDKSLLEWEDNEENGMVRSSDYGLEAWE